MSAELLPEQHAHFRERGYVVVGPIVSDDEADVLCAAFDALLDRFASECGVSTERYLEVVSQWTNLWRHHEAFARQIHHPRVTAVARELLDASAVRLFHDHVIYKPTCVDGELRSAAVPWHQDYPFWPVDRPRAVSCWLALDTASAASGAMRFMPAAHLDGEEAPVDFLHQSKDWGEREPDAVTVEVPRGWAVFHDCLSWHMSPPNTTCSPRRAFISIMLDARCTWAPEHSGWHPMNDHVTVAPGQPFNDDAFPILGARHTVAIR